MNEMTARDIWKQAFEMGRWTRREEHSVLHGKLQSERTTSLWLEQENRRFQDTITDLCNEVRQLRDGELPDGSVIPITATKQAGGEGSVVMDWFKPFQQMPSTQKEIARYVWGQGVKFGRRSTPPRWLIFLFGLFVGVAWSLFVMLVMHNLGVFTK